MATEEERLAYLRNKFGYSSEPPAQESSALRRVGDVGVDVARGAIGLGRAAVGLGNMATAGALQRGIQDYYRPDEAEQFLSQYYGSERQAEEKKIQESQGFTGRLGALASEPGALIGRAVQSLPSMLPAIKGAQLAQAAGLSRGAIGTAAAAGEGLTTAAQQGQEVIGRDPENVAGMYLQVPAGAATGAISKFAGRFGGDIEAALAGRGLGLSGSTAARVGKGAFGEGVAEEFPQSMQEQIFMNLAEGRPWDENILEAGAEGLLIGGLTGGVFGALSPQEATAAIEEDKSTPPAAPPPVVPPATEQPLAPAGSPDLQGQAESPSAAGVVDEVLPTAEEVLAPEPAAQPAQPSDLIQGEAPQTAALREAAAKTQARIAMKNDVRAAFEEISTEVNGKPLPKGVVTTAINRITKDKNSIDEVVAAIDEQLAKPVNNRNADSQEILTRLRARLVPEEVAPAEPVAVPETREEVIPSAAQEIIEPAGVQAEPESGVVSGQAAETGVSDSVLRAEEGPAAQEEVVQEAPTPDQTLARVGTTPKNSQPVTVRDGVIYVGDEPAVNYDTGEDVRAEGTSVEEIGTALRAAGVLTSKQKVFKAAPPAQVEEQRAARPSGQTIGTVLQRLKGEFGINGISRLISKGVLNVVQSVDNLPIALRNSVAPNSPAFYSNGKVYMIADRLSPAGIRKAFLHELGEHYGLEDMLGSQRYREVLKSITTLAKTDGDVAAALDYVRRNYEKYADGSEKQAREVIAHLGETAPNHNLWQKIVSWVKTWLVKQGFTKVKDLSAADLQDFVARSARRGLAGDVRMYSQSRLFSAEQRVEDIDEARWEATLPQQVGDTISAVKANVPVQDLLARVKKFGLKTLMLHQIDELYGDKLSITKDGKVRRPIKEFTDSLLRMGRARDEIQRQAASSIQRSSTLPAQSKARLDKARPALSLLGFKSKDVLRDGKVVAVEVEDWGKLAPEEAKKIWGSLTATEKLAYADMRAEGQRLHKGLLAAIKAQLESFGPKGKALVNDFIATAGTLKGDYFPLFRSGDHVVVWKSQQYLTAESQGNDAEMTRMKQMIDSPHYIVERFETLDDALRLQNELNDKGKLRGDTEEQFEGKALYYKQPEFISGLDRIPQAFVQKLNEALDVNLSDIDARIQGAKNAGDMIQAQWLEQQKEMAEYNEGLKSLITQMYVQALPEYSAAKRHLHRSGIAGYSTNSLKAFANYAERVAGATAKARHMQQVLDALTLAGEAAREAGKAGDPTFQDVVDVLRLHQEAIINPRHRPGAWQGWLSNAAYIWYLGMTPAFALTNLSQGFMVSAPVIAGRLGMNQLKVQKALIKAMGDAFGVNKSWIAEAEGNIFRRIYNAKPNYMEVPQVDENGNPTGVTELTLDLSGSGLNADEQALVRSLYEKSAIDINQTNDLVTSAEGLSLTQRESMKVLSLFAHHSEVLNRIATGLAAYRMAKEMGAAKDTGVDPEAFAAKIIDDTHFNYMNTNAPLFLKPGYNPIATVMGQFRKYQIGMLTLLGRNMALAIRGVYRATKGGVRSEEEVAALRTLNGLLMSHAVVAGSLGMPLAGAIAAIVAAALDDDDDPWNSERVTAEYRNWMAELMGVDAAEVAAHGVFRLPGVKDVLPSTLGERVGQQDLASPFRNLRVSERERARDTMLKTIGAAMTGPSGGMVGDLLTAWEMIGKGEFERGVEYAVPKFVRDVFKTYRFAEEGVTTSRGETRIGPDAFEGMDLFWQSMGFAPSEVTELYRAQGAVQGYSEAIAARRSNLISRVANARMRGDNEEAARVRDDLIAAFNAANPEARILPKDLMSAYRSRTRAQQRINEQGIEVSRRRPGEAELGRFANVE